MSEQPVFWLGGKPGKSKANERPVPEAERYEAAIREACEDCGFKVDEYVAAQGGFGGWLVHLNISDSNYRLFWSGKQQQLTLDQAGSNGGWQQLKTADTPDEGVAGFVKALRALLAVAGKSGKLGKSENPATPGA